MTRREALIEFKRYILPFVRTNDKPARAEAWNNFTDALCKSGRISIQQYETWGHPR